VMERAETAARASGAAVRCLAHAASGVVRVAVLRADGLADLVARLRPESERRGGTCVVHRADAAAAAGLDRWGDPGEGLALMRGLKAAFDPAGIFAPGRFVGGL
jgi:glycolate oxidase FAD binding subunit